MTAETLKDVPIEKVGEVVQSFVNGGARNILSAKNDDGTFDVTARSGLSIRTDATIRAASTKPKPVTKRKPGKKTHSSR